MTCGGCGKTCFYQNVVQPNSCDEKHHDYKRMCPCGDPSAEGRDMPVASALPPLCEAGKYSAGSTSTVCIDCVAGKFSTAVGALAVATCSSCHAGKYKAEAGATACDNCAAGKYKANEGVNLACDICEAGKYKATSGVNTACDNCVAGKYKVVHRCFSLTVRCDIRVTLPELDHSLN